MPFKPSKPKAPLSESGLYDYAIKALGRTMRTEAELRRLMRQRVEPGEPGEAIVNSVVLRLKEHGYLDDKSFAETFTRLRVENEKLGQRTVRQKLAQKGVPAPIANETIEARYANTDEEALARQHIERKRLKKPENEKETARVLRRLIAAGFSTRVIYKILRQWDVPEETLSALDSLEDEPPHE
ncbi:regulatory protein RecX [Terracidiphilus sp.]|jgi:regulatory protein|uniref:regulatory protein RecX n=1 Tax=Terracidiphilus sp. TaxID=1964191 RepID=UPI003C1FD615